MNVVLVEDEVTHQNIIVRYLNRFLPDPKQIRVFGTLEEAEVGIKLSMPELLLLDINLPDGLSFELLERLGRDNIKAKIIFVSAHDDYAIRAFKFSAIDYILKPVDAIELQMAVTKVLDEQEQAIKLDALRQNLLSNTQQKKLVLKDAHTVFLIDISEVIRCESASNYTTFHLTGNRQIVVSTTLKEYDKMLQGQTFFRTHQSHLINLMFFDRYDKRDGGFIVMKDESMVPLSKRKKELLMNKLEELS